MTAEIVPSIAVYGQRRTVIRPPSERALDRWCAELGVELPADYRAFVLERNGGKPRPGWMQIRAQGKVQDIEIGEFTAWSDDPGAESVSVVAQTKALRASHGLPSKYIVMAWIKTPGATVPLLLSIERSDKAPIILWVGGSTKAKFKADMTFPAIAGSVSALLASLDYPAAGRPWMKAIEDGDDAGFARWLDGAADIDAAEPASGLRPIEFAAERGRGAMVSRLLAKGAKPGEAFLAAVEGGHYGLAKTLLAAGVPAKQLAKAQDRLEVLLPDRALSALIEAALAAAKRTGRKRR